MTHTDLAAGRIRLRREAKRFFPSERGSVEVVLRGERLTGRYDPRSAVLSLEQQALARLVQPDEVLEVERGPAGVVRLDRAATARSEG